MNIDCYSIMQYIRSPVVTVIRESGPEHDASFMSIRVFPGFGVSKFGFDFEKQGDRVKNQLISGLTLSFGQLVEVVDDRPTFYSGPDSERFLVSIAHGGAS